jgi:hypothetical protein
MYSLEVSVVSASLQDDMGSGMDAGNSISQGLAISTPASGTGFLDETDTQDFYKVSLHSGGQLSIDVTPPSGADFDLILYDPAGNQVDSSLNGGSSVDSVSYAADTAGDWYVLVYRYADDGTYSLALSFAPVSGALLESPHPYPNDYDYTWTITEVGAGQVRTHFSQIDTEQDWDYLYVYDAGHNLIASYTGSYRDIWSPWVPGDTVRIRLASDSLSTDYGFTLDATETLGAVVPDPTDKYAVVVGINEYRLISNLNFCVNDATDWRDYLVGEGYTISSFLIDDQATETNITNAISTVIAAADYNDTVVFAFSGHGGPFGAGSILCCHDYSSGTNGGFTDIELQDAFSTHGGRLFIFLDSCHSGGMNEVVTNDPSGLNRYMTTTCTADGFGWDEPAYQNGMWAYWFLERGLVAGESGSDDMEGNFDWGRSSYPYTTGVHVPQEFDGDPTGVFYLGR